MLKRISSLLTVFFISFFADAQIDTEFWFAPPDLTQGTGNESFRDRPIFLVLSTINEEAEIRIVQPANPDFDPIEVVLPAGQSQDFELTAFVDMLETKPANSILPTGLLIQSTAPITAYYEIRNNSNTDIFALKGKNGKGMRFYTPFQTLWENDQHLGGNPYIPAPRAGFIVVATMDTTLVTITPSIDIVGHPAGVPFTIELDRGETYYCEADSSLPEDRPAGSLIVSDKPITVTVKDDMIDYDMDSDGGADVAGDQLIAYEYTGREHIVVKSNLTNPPGDKVYILATADNTEIFVDGAVDPVAVLNEGEQYLYNFVTDVAFINASEKIYVWHISGVGDQIAGAIIPSLECTGSNQVGFVRSTSQNFALNITIRSGSEGEFLLNGDPDLVPASAFEPVPGTDGEFVYARIEYPNNVLPAGASHQLQNFSDELFHLGITNKSNGPSCNYGYFSNFSYLNLGGFAQVCLGDSVVLDAGPGKTSYLWSTGDTTQKVTIYEPGTYYVEVLSGSDCVATDTIEVEYYLPPIDLPNDTICEGTSLIIAPDAPYNYFWSDGSEGDTFTVNGAGIYWVEVEDFQGCRTRDSLEIFTSPRPVTPVITGDTTLCEGETLTLGIGELEDASYRWILPDGSILQSQELSIENISIEDAGYYKSHYLVDGCESFNDSVLVLIDPIPVVNLGADTLICGDTPLLLVPTEDGIGDFLWHDGFTGPTFLASASGEYFVEVTNSFGCSSSDTISIEFVDFPTLPIISGDTIECAGSTLELFLDDQENVEYFWTGPNDLEYTGGTLTIDTLDGIHEGEYFVYAIRETCSSDTAVVSVIINPTPGVFFGEDVLQCGDEPVVLVPTVTGDGVYQWQDGSSGETFTVTETGNYTLAVTNEFDCSGYDEIQVTFVDFPEQPEVSGDFEGCEGEDLSIVAAEQDDVEFIWSGPNGFEVTAPNLDLTNISLDNNGVYTVIASRFGCESTSQDFSVIVNANPIPVLPDDTLITCRDSSLFISVAENFDTYLWSTGEDTPSINAQSGDYWIEVTNEFGCAGSDTIHISENSLDAAFITNPEEVAALGQEVEFFDESDPGDGNIVLWDWNFGDGNSSPDQNPIHIYEKPGIFTIILTITDDMGCIGIAEQIIEIASPISIPNIFTPNGDGKNDMFVIEGLEHHRGHLQVFNRWGAVIFTSDPYQNNWDANDFPDGVYFYTLELRNGEKYKGEIHILRN